MTQSVTLSQRERVKYAQKHHGLLARVAKRCSVSHSLVSRVLHGKNTSKRVNDAIDAEIRAAIKRDDRWREKISTATAPAPGEAVA